jgi:hypothetical protein
MSSFVYTPAKQKIAKGDADFDTLDVRAILVMTNTTADTDQDAASIADIGTLDEYDGSGYSRPDLGASTITQDDANNRSEIDYGDFTFGATVAAGTRQAAGMVIYVEVGTDAQDWPVAWVDTGGFPFAGNGGAINVTVNAEGLLQVT